MGINNPTLGIAGIDAEEAGTPITGGPFTTLNFSTNTTAADGGAGVLDIEATGGGSGIDAEDNGTPITGGPFNTINFGANINVTDAGGGVLDVSVTGGGGGSGGLYDISMGVPVAPTQIGNSGVFVWTENPGIGLNVKYPGGGIGSSIAGWLEPQLPGVAWEYAFLSLHNNAGFQYYGEAIGVYDSISDKLITTVSFQGSTNSCEFMEWNNPSSRFGITTVAFNGAHAQGPRWLHLKDDGLGNISFGISQDGANPFWINVEPITDFVITYDNIVYGAFFESGMDAPTCSSTILCVDPNGAARVMGG